MRRRLFPVQLGFVLLWCSTSVAFDFQAVRALAAARVARAYEPRTNHFADAVGKLSYVENRAITFNEQKALWRDAGVPFELEFFHPGYVVTNSVTIHEIIGQEVRLIPFQADYFDYGTNRLGALPDLGFAGFRAIQSANHFGEVAAFVGASYFRMIGSGQAYGTSARGLALNTGVPEGEEFPAFEQFWILRPGKNSTTLTVYALLDSPSATGAYQFIIQPGVETVAVVKAAIFPRRPVKVFGIAPLTSMYLYGENGRPNFEDYRPEVHDADGLLIHNGRDEWIWHPLEKGKMIRVNAFQDEDPQGFGLLQRDRDYEHYQDVVAQFHRRPSVWVRPIGKWGAGAVELFQLPSDREFMDNVVAFWVPADAPKVGAALDLEYELRWTKAEPAPKSLGHVRDTRVGRVFVEPAEGPPNLRLVVDFDGAVESLSAKEKLSAKIVCGEGVKPVAVSVFKNEENRTWRLVIELADPGKAMDLRACLMRGAQPVTETWTFTWQP